jgi:hypothetical protein
VVRFAQWIIGLAVVAASGVATFILLSPGETDRLRQANEALAREKFELQRSIERLTSADRRAEVYVVEQIKAGELVDGKPAETDLTTLDFVELDRDGHPLPSRRVTIQGTAAHFKTLVIMFDHEHVAMGDALRGKSLALFAGVFGDYQRPVDAVPLEKVGDVPDYYRVNSQPNEFEQKLWSRFWDYARDPDLRQRDGVRLVQVENPSMPMRKGDAWTISLQHNAGLNLKLRVSGEGPAAGRQDEQSPQG